MVCQWVRNPLLCVFLWLIFIAVIMAYLARRRWEWVSKVFGWVRRGVIILLYVLLVLAAITTVCLVWRRFGLLTAIECPNCVTSYADWIAGKLGTDVAKLEKEGKFAPVVSDILVLLAFVVVIVPLLQAWQYRRRLRRELQGAHGLEVFKVKKERVDDLGKMLEYYEGAEHITVFCGDFDWLQPSSIDINPKFSRCSKRLKKKIKKMTGEMRDFVKGYASQGEITLVSSKSDERVKDALSDGGDDSLFEALQKRFVFSQDVGIKCSLIKRSDVEYTFLYRSYAGGKQHLFNAHIFTRVEESEELISILRHLIEYTVKKAKQENTSSQAKGIDTKVEKG